MISLCCQQKLYFSHIKITCNNYCETIVISLSVELRMQLFSKYSRLFISLRIELCDGCFSEWSKENISAIGTRT